MKNIHTPLVSVIIPVYNVESYLEESLDCIVNQTLRDIEIVCVNDGSEDRSLEILERYAQNDERVKIITQENSGLSVARNTGYLAARGRYLLFFDSDDLLEVRALEILCEIAEEDHLDVLQFDADAFCDDDSYADRTYSFNKHYIRKREYSQILRGVRYFVLLQRANDYVPNSYLQLIRRSILVKKNLLHYPGILHEDELFTLQLLLSSERVRHTQQTFYHRRVRANSIMTVQHGMPHMKGLLTCVNELYKFIQSLDLQQEELELVVMRMVSFLKRVRGIYDALSADEKYQLLSSSSDRVLAMMMNQTHPNYKPNIVGLAPRYTQEKLALSRRNSEKKLASLVSIVLYVEEEANASECMNNLLKQTHENIEVLCSYRLAACLELEQYRKDKRIKLLGTANGIGEAYNLGLRAASGEYIIFLSAAERLATAGVQTLLSIAQSNELDVVYGGIIREQNMALCTTKLNVHLNAYWTDRVIYPESDREICLYPMPVCEGLYRLELLKRYQISFDGAFAEPYHDLYFWMRIIMCYQRIGFVNQPFLLEARLNHPIRDENHIYDLIAVFDRANKNFIEKSPRKLQDARVFIKTYYDLAMDALRMLDDSFRLLFLKRFRDSLNIWVSEQVLENKYLLPDDKSRLKLILRDYEVFYHSNAAQTLVNARVAELEALNEQIIRAQSDSIRAQMEAKSVQSSEEIKISLIIPMYNAEEWLRECLDSIGRQTLKELEIIVIDDGSTDDSLAILREHQDKDQRIVFISQAHGGAGRARNKGLQRARGEFIAFIDSDDFYPDSRSLETLYSSAVAHDALICGGNIVEDHNGTIRRQPVDFQTSGFMEYSDFQYDYGYQRFIFSKGLIDQNGIIFPDYLRGQDPPFLVEAMIAAGRFYAMNISSYGYRCGYAPVSWNTKKLNDSIMSLSDILVMSKEHSLERLHYTIAVKRFGQRKKLIMDSFKDGNYQILKELFQANDEVEVELLQKVDNQIPDTFMIEPLAGILKRYGSLPDSTMKQENSSQRIALDEQEEQLKRLNAARLGELQAIKGSVSFRIGRAITWPLRKVRTFARVMREGGLRGIFEVCAEKLQKNA